LKKFLIIYLIAATAQHILPFTWRFDRCNAFGSIYFTKNKNEAHFIIYIEESEAMADLKVFKTDSPLAATQAGLWHVTDIKPAATYIVYIETERKSMADFTVAYTTNEAFATCQ
jgi:hypothetical protein